MDNRVIAVDVDGTLYSKGCINVELVEWCRIKKEQGFKIILWSARGEIHAQKVAEDAGIILTFDIIMGKPSIIVDDKGWSWIKYTKVLPPNSPHFKKGEG